MEREKELLKIFEDAGDTKNIVAPLISDMVFLEERLNDLKKLPFIRVNPKNPMQQKETPAAKLFNQQLAQYHGIVKTLSLLLSRNGSEEESPLRAFMKTFER